MAIQGPLNTFSENDKRLIRLLERLLLECTYNQGGANVADGTAPLSDEDARELVTRIDAALESKEFWETSYLIEAISRGQREKARDIYLSARARNGFSRIMSGSKYHSFLVRLGYEKSYLPGTMEMDYEYFVRMERKLHLQIGIQPVIVDLLERFLWTHAEQVNAARKGTNQIEDGLLIKSLKAVRPIRDVRGRFVDEIWSTNRIAGALTLFANMTVMFTTRDWTVTGTMSAMAGALGLITKG
jgi:hypothetical protein